MSEQQRIPTLAELEDAAAATPPGTPRPDRQREERQPDITDLQARVQAIRDKAAQAGRLVTPEEQRAIDLRRQADALAREHMAELEKFRAAVEGIPTRFRRAQVTHPATREWVEDVVQDRTTDSLVLLGGVGTGKTSEAFAAWTEILRARPMPAGWFTVPALLEACRPGREARVNLTDAERLPLLLLDDLAAERGSEWTTEVLYRLLDHRYAWCLPTIITTNVPPTEVRERLGDRIASRLNGMGRRVVIEGPDRRTHPGA